MAEEKIYTIEAVAKILQVHPQTIRRMIHKGELAAFKVGYEYRIRQSALEKLMNERKDK